MVTPATGPSQRPPRFGRSIPLVLVGILALPVALEARTLRAERYDVTLAPRADGSLEVHETVTFVFDSDGDPYRLIYREVPLSRTDGIEIVSASLDGRALALTGPDVRVVERPGNVRVEVRFSPVYRGKHTMDLRYVARQAIARDDDLARLRWTPLPDRRGYEIGESRVEVTWAGLGVGPLSVRTRRDDGVRLDAQRRDGAMVFTSRRLASGSTYEARLEFPVAAFSPTPPRWQGAEAARRAGRQRQALLGAAIFGAVVMGFALFWRRHRPRPGEAGRVTAIKGPPSDVPVALASALTRLGRTTAGDVEATIVDLARQGFLRIDAVRAASGPPALRAVRRHEAPPAHAHERAALDLCFPDGQRGPREVRLADVRRRAGANLTAFRRAVRDDLRRRGWIDEHRIGARRAMVRTGAWLLAASSLPVALVALAGGRDALGASLTAAAGLAAGALAGLAFGAIASPLSDRGAAERLRWTAYRKALTGVVHAKAAPPAIDWNTTIPFVVASGLSGALATHAVNLGVAVPDWFGDLRRRADHGDRDAFLGWLGHLGSSAEDHAASGGGDGGGSSAGADGGGGGASGAD